MTTDFKTRRKRGLREASVNVISSDMLFAAEHENKLRIDQSAIEGEGGVATEDGVVTHKRPDTVVMYKPDGRGHFTPRMVPVTAIQQNLLSGFKSICPECNSHHGADPNDCEGRDPTAVRICPVCGKRIYDNLVYQRDIEVEKDDDDPNVIHDDSYAASTPASRTKAQLNRHIWIRHPITAEIMNLDPIPEPPKSVIDALDANARIS